MTTETHVLQAIKKTLIDWQPYSFVTDDMDDPELDGETRAIYKQRHRIQSPLDAAHVIARVFASSFSDTSRFNADQCKEVGAVLYTTLDELGAL